MELLSNFLAGDRATLSGRITAEVDRGGGRRRGGFFLWLGLIVSRKIPTLKPRGFISFSCCIPFSERAERASVASATAGAATLGRGEGVEAPDKTKREITLSFFLLRATEGNSAPFLFFPMVPPFFISPPPPPPPPPASCVHMLGKSYQQQQVRHVRHQWEQPRRDHVRGLRQEQQQPYLC